MQNLRKALSLKHKLQRLTRKAQPVIHAAHALTQQLEEVHHSLQQACKHPRAHRHRSDAMGSDGDVVTCIFCEFEGRLSETPFSKSIII